MNSKATHEVRASTLPLEAKGLNNKTQTLSQFRETRDDMIYTNNFELEEGENLDLSYSKFSQLSGSSFIVRNSTKSGSISDSPFLKRIQNKLDKIEVTSSSSRSSDELKPSKSHRSRDIHQFSQDEDIARSNKKEREIYLITESQVSYNEENNSPFLERTSTNPILSHANTNPIRLRKLRSSKDIQAQSEHIHNPFEIPSIMKQGGPRIILEDPLRPPPAIAADSTPERTNRHQRNPSVKVSLTPAQRFEKKPGTRLANALENFKFSTMVGKGAFACVYKGINLKTKQVVAIKQILLEKGRDVGELMGEIDLLKILKHPNIVKYHGFVKTSNSLNVFLEFCSGGSLRQLYKRIGHGLPEKQIIEFSRLILLGLNYLHEQGVVHRDVKAANVLITDEGDIKLADFGVATKVTSQHESVVGTPNWMAPETVLGGEGLCTASDIWSLGATIIELFTTNPPYHDLNPMATLHAIGTDDHPPLPKSISSLAKDFLLECFQKQPSLRINAKLLLKHRWLTQSGNLMKQSMSDMHKSGDHSNTEYRSIKSYSESNEENWEDDFAADVKISKLQTVLPAIIEIDDVDKEFKTMIFEAPSKYTKAELLEKFVENNDAFGEDSMGDFSSLKSNDKKLVVSIDNEKLEEESDPFLNLDIENFDTNELEIQSKMEYLVSKFSSRVDVCHSGSEDVIASLVKITGRMLHLVKKYPVLHDTLIRDHGILSFLELFDMASELPKNQKLWYHTLSVLNILFESNVSQLENFCLLGGIPGITQFRNVSFDPPVRLQVVKFIQLFNTSDKALSMFVSSGGLRVVSKFVEEDFDTTPTFPLVSIECIYNILSKDLTRSKSDLCRILSKYGVIFWFVVLLNRLTKFKSKTATKTISKEQVNITIDRIMEIIKYFGQSEARVRMNISNADLFKLLIKVFNSLEFHNQLIILKFFKSMSCISDTLKSLHQAEISDFLLGLLMRYVPSSEHYKEVINIVCPTLYNCCYLNHTREIEIVRLGAVPYLKSLSMINLPFRQFVLPILCELVYCDDYVKDTLKKHDILSVYYNLLLDPYWQSNALDSILSWATYDPLYVELDGTLALDCLVGGFMLPKVSNLESTLDSYLKLMSTNKKIVDRMLKSSVINHIMLKLKIHNKNPVVQLTLLRILKLFISYAYDADLLEPLNISRGIAGALDTLRSKSSSLLVEELISEIFSFL